MEICDFEGKCKNKAFREVYPMLFKGKYKNRGWSYLCKKHFYEEQKRFIREGFSSDEELTMYDLLFKEVLTPNEIKRLKNLASDLLRKIKEVKQVIINYPSKGARLTNSHLF